MLAEDYEIDEPYSSQLPYISSASVGVLDAPSGEHVSVEEDTSRPPRYPSEPLSAPPAPPHKRPGRAGMIILLTLLCTVILGAGLFASGWEFAHNSTSVGVTTTAKEVTQASGNTIETQQEAAIAKIEPAVVELQVTTAQGQQIGSGVIIDANGDIVTNNHVVSGEQAIEVVLNNGSTEHAQLVGTDAAADLAVVHIQPFTHMTVVQLGDSSKLAVGQRFWRLATRSVSLRPLLEAL